jgi:hypothetical protein
VCVFVCVYVCVCVIEKGSGATGPVSSGEAVNSSTNHGKSGAGVCVCMCVCVYM